MRSLAVLLALLALGGCKGDRESDANATRVPAPEPKRHSELMLTESVRGSRPTVLASVTLSLACSAYRGDHYVCRLRQSNGDFMEIDQETKVKVATGRAEEVLGNLQPGMAMMMVREAGMGTVREADGTLIEDEGDVLRCDIMNLGHGVWTFNAYRFDLSPEWIDWKARQHVGACDELGWGHDAKAIHRVIRRCRVLEGRPLSEE